VKEYDGHFKDKPYFNEIARGVIYGNQGQIFKEEGDYKKAEELFKKSIEINSKKGGDNRDAQLNQLMLAEVYFLTNQPDSMQGILLKSRKSLDSIENKQAEIDWNRLSWKYYDSKQQPALAYKYLKTFTALNDSVQKVKNELNTYDVSEQINTLENEYKINSLEKENKVKNLYLLIFVITTAFGVAIFLFALFILRNTETNYKILEGLNKQIKEQKIRLEEALQKVEEKSKEKDRILRGVAHDLRTPAASISMLTDLILTENNDKARSEMLKLVKTSCDNSLELISEILEAAGMPNNNEIRKGKTDVNELLRDAVAALGCKANEKQQKIIIDYLQPASNILGNKEKMQRVIINLVTNAIKFSETGSEIYVAATRLDGSIRIKVADQGIGIPDNLKGQVFDMFTEAKRIGTAGEKPYGLGLSICRQIVEAHDGKIWFTTTKGKGTSFYVELKEA
jgi:signal transduction histidine kinase